jgi:hypothetical protein
VADSRRKQSAKSTNSLPYMSAVLGRLGTDWALTVRAFASSGQARRELLSEDYRQAN